MHTSGPTILPRPGTHAADPRVAAHFHASAALYRLWSPEGHLHFGHWRWPMDPFGRRAMLEAMVWRVVDQLAPAGGMRLADLGCGYGSAGRLVARRHAVHVDGFTVVHAQVTEGRRAVHAEGLDGQVRLHQRDFRHTGLAAGSVDGVFALESLCYGSGPGKGDVLREAHRILKPGGRLALVDGFLLKRPRGWRRRLVRTVEDGWALPCFPQRDAFTEALRRAGFDRITVHDLSWNVAPSALHGLPMVGWTALRDRLRIAPLRPLERAHLRSCLLGIVLGTQRHLFRYLMIAAVKA